MEESGNRKLEEEEGIEEQWKRNTKVLVNARNKG
jgi:hypothetical protein